MIRKPELGGTQFLGDKEGVAGCFSRRVRTALCSALPADGWVKVAAMSTAAGTDHVSAQRLPPGSSPQAIRAALLPEEVGNFDREYRREMAAAIETLDLTPVIEMLARWQLVARSSQDPQAHRRMLAHAAILNAGGDIPRTPWQETKARLGLVGVHR